MAHPGGRVARLRLADDPDQQRVRVGLDEPPLARLATVAADRRRRTEPLRPCGRPRGVLPALRVLRRHALRLDRLAGPRDRRRDDGIHPLFRTGVRGCLRRDHVALDAVRPQRVARPDPRSLRRHVGVLPDERLRAGRVARARRGVVTPLARGRGDTSHAPLVVAVAARRLHRGRDPLHGQPQHHAPRRLDVPGRRSGRPRARGTARADTRRGEERTRTSRSGRALCRREPLVPPPRPVLREPHRLPLGRPVLLQGAALALGPRHPVQPRASVVPRARRHTGRGDARAAPDLALRLAGGRAPAHGAPGHGLPTSPHDRARRPRGSVRVLHCHDRAVALAPEPAPCDPVRLPARDVRDPRHGRAAHRRPHSSWVVLRRRWRNH